MAYTLVQFYLVKFMFVDGTYLFTLGRTMSYDQEIRVCTQENPTDWHEGLKLLGGALKQDKCYWYWVAFNWKWGKWRYTPLHRLNWELERYISSRERVLISKHRPQNSHKPLGYIQRLDGNMKEEVKPINGIYSKW